MNEKGVNAFKKLYTSSVQEVFKAFVDGEVSVKDGQHVHEGLKDCIQSTVDLYPCVKGKATLCLSESLSHRLVSYMLEMDEDEELDEEELLDGTRELMNMISGKFKEKINHHGYSLSFSIPTSERGTVDFTENGHEVKNSISMTYCHEEFCLIVVLESE